MVRFVLTVAGILMMLAGAVVSTNTDSITIASAEIPIRTFGQLVVIYGIICFVVALLPDRFYSASDASDPDTGARTLGEHGRHLASHSDIRPE